MKNILWQTILMSSVSDLVSLTERLLALSAVDTLWRPGHKSLSSRAVWGATRSPQGRTLSSRLNCSMHLISFLFIRLFQHHFPVSSAEEPDGPAERPTTEPNPIPSLILSFGTVSWEPVTSPGSFTIPGPRLNVRPSILGRFPSCFLLCFPSQPKG